MRPRYLFHSFIRICFHRYESFCRSSTHKGIIHGITGEQRKKKKNESHRDTAKYKPNTLIEYTFITHTYRVIQALHASVQCSAVQCTNSVHTSGLNCALLLLLFGLFRGVSFVAILFIQFVYYIQWMMIYFTFIRY